MKKVNIFLILRVIASGVFIFSGGEKLLSPYENFLYVIQNYQVLPSPALERLVASTFPWIEFFLGVFLFVGLWTRLSLCGVGLMSASFIVVVSQAIFRKLPIESCGCFGELIKAPLPVIVGMDSAILICVILMLRHLARTKMFSLDRYFSRNEG